MTKQIKRRSFIKVLGLGGGMLLVGNPRGFTLPAGKPSDPVQNGKLWTQTGRFTHQQLIGYGREYGLPLFVYDGDLMAARFAKFKRAFEQHYPRVKVHYALKANTNLSIVGLLKQAGAAAECISMGEIQIARKLGYQGSDILFTASSKSPDELEYAVSHGVTVNLDSLSDLTNLEAVIARLNKTVNISFRINPDVDPHTHRHISTGHKFSKFGILLEGDEAMEAYGRAARNPLIRIRGVHSHIGSQILDLEPFERNVKLVASVVKALRQRLGIQLEFIDLGGGLGIPYLDGQQGLEPETVAEKVSAMLKQELAELGPLPELWLEPGRYFVAEAGILLARVNSVKDTPYQHFINLNTGFNHLVRPILYEAHHRVRVLGGQNSPRNYEVAGNICETGDILGHERYLPTPVVGDTVAILDAGAYGFSMASEYNSFLLPAEILVRGQKAAVIRRRAQFEDLLRNQVLLPDLKT